MGAAGCKHMVAELSRTTAFLAASVGLSAMLIFRTFRKGQQGALSTSACEATIRRKTIAECEAEERSRRLLEEAESVRSQWAEDVIELCITGQVDAVRSKLQEPKDPAELHSFLATTVPLVTGDWVSLTPAVAAALHAKADVLRLLLEGRADPDSKSLKSTSWDGAFTLTENDTALCLAAKEGHLECVRLLLEGRADPNVQCDSSYMEGSVEWGEDDDGSEQMLYTALDVAKNNKRLDCAEVIKRFGGVTVMGDTVQPRRLKVTCGSRMGA
eukprot:TRINITY_DN69701_c0_g1_i1.p1 TRINITY_DN69701_c0_g1~~TRINITY_DN69701_c0_g1_i1.p1  ORF type:complete len:271 (+),score=50.71 TRINITY_DN69701_c0_g1_i1:86-898(+)